MAELLSAQHILVAQEYEAKDILRKLDQKNDFEKLAQDFSICSSSKNGGYLGQFPRGKMVPAFEKALISLKPGEYSGIVRTQFGYHIIKRIPTT
ncbi:MAG: peptidylprolyl isomerase [Bacteriovoracaceae bacterium]